jgi:hypothetical protein
MTEIACMAENLYSPEDLNVKCLCEAEKTFGSLRVPYHHHHLALQLWTPVLFTFTGLYPELSFSILPSPSLVGPLERHLTWGLPLFLVV